MGRNSGSAAQNMADVACGRVSCYYEHGYGGPWDVCAGTIIVREAGGVVYNAVDNTEFQMHYGKGSVCCGNKDVVKDVLHFAQEPEVKFSFFIIYSGYNIHLQNAKSVCFLKNPLY